MTHVTLDSCHAENLDIAFIYTFVHFVISDGSGLLRRVTGPTQDWGTVVGML